MNTKQLDQTIQQHPLAAVGAVVGILLLLGLGGWEISKLVSGPPAKPEVMAVSFGDGQNTVVVNGDGAVTITTPFGTFNQTWDKDKTRQFFSKVNDLDFDTLTNFVGSGVAIQLTLGNGRMITTTVAPALEGMADQLQKSLEETYTNNQERYLGIIEQTHVADLTLATRSDSTVTTGTNTPAPSQSPTNPWQTGTDPQTGTKFSCSQIDSKTGKKVIVSNTVCGK